MTLEELTEAVAQGAVDTVLLAMTDMQGRLQGKRLTATHFLDEVAEHGAESCNYLLAVDVDMRTVAGYAMSSWEGGYGDMLLVPDLDTLRPVPWAGGHGGVSGRRRLARRLGRGGLPAPDTAQAARAAGRARMGGQRRHRTNPFPSFLRPACFFGAM